LGGRMDMKKLREKLEEVEKVYEEKLKQVKAVCVAGQEWREEELLF